MTNDASYRVIVALIRAAIFFTLAAIGFGLITVARADDNQQWLLSWIPASCCVTNSCCWQISSREVTPLPGDQWRVNSTGQVVARNGWSPDGRFYRCACDLDHQTRQWNRHQGASTRCLFVPQQLY